MAHVENEVLYASTLLPAFIDSSHKLKSSITPNFFICPHIADHETEKERERELLVGFGNPLSSSGDSRAALCLYSPRPLTIRIRIKSELKWHSSYPYLTCQRRREPPDYLRQYMPWAIWQLTCMLSLPPPPCTPPSCSPFPLPLPPSS